MSAFVTNVTEATFVAEVEQSDLPVVVDFWAPWCGPCKAIAPLFDELAQMYQGRIKFAKVNVDDNKELARRFGIRGIPALLLLKNGEVCERGHGDSKTRLVALLDSHAVDAAPASASISAPAKKLSAFHGDTGIREKFVTRLRTHIQAAQIVASAIPALDEEKNLYTLFAAAAHSADPAVYESELGIPATVGMLEQVIDSTFLRQEIDADRKPYLVFDAPFGDYSVRWLQGIPPGADLQSVTARFLCRLLLDLHAGTQAFAADTTVEAKAIAGQVAALHGRSYGGDLPSAAEWKVARDAAIQTERAACAGEAVSGAVIRLAESVAWPAAEAGNAASQAVATLLQAVGEIAIERAYGPDRWAARKALIEAFRRKVNEPDFDAATWRESDVFKAHAAWAKENGEFETTTANERKRGLAEYMHAVFVDCTLAAAAH